MVEPKWELKVPIYDVETKEIYIVSFRIEADTPEQARDFAATGLSEEENVRIVWGGESLVYHSQLPREEWTVLHEGEIVL